MGESELNKAAAEDATAPETLRQNGPLEDKRWKEGGPYGLVKHPADGVSLAAMVDAMVNLSGPKDSWWHLAA